MSYFGRFSPVRAYRDLRVFLANRGRHELAFLALAVAITSFFVYAFEKDSVVETDYHRDIIYVQQWRADRTDAEIRAQQKIDAPIKAKQMAEDKAADDARRAAFQRADQAMNQWGL